ncbi:MAG TPA: GAF domain-containing protein, partial [Tepidisphaeraceae bacterium]|nr:GAF domain-containing protein [Tepidisphaeraceae bacterium]
MLTRLRRSSLRVKASCLGAGCVVLACGLTVLLLPLPGETVDHPEAANLRAVLGASATSAAVFALLFGWLLRPLHRLQRDLGKLTSGGEAQLASDPRADREVRRLRSGFRTLAQQITQLRCDDDDARQALEIRTSTVNRILEFSQIVQGVGRVEQVYATLTHYLRTELNLLAIAIIETDDTSTARLAARWPDELVPQAGGFDCASCPCFRQALPRCFNDGNCPVRCGVEQWLDIPTALPALCVPISSTGPRRAVIHMVRPSDLPWDEAARQLTQTFVHSASAAIVLLDLLEDARRAG